MALIATSLITPPRHLAAQGGPKTSRPAPGSSSTTTGQPSLQLPRSLVQQLVGRWRFAIWFAGNFDGPPDASGTRVADTLYDDLRLQWTEQFDNSASRSQGIMGFDQRTGRLYRSAVYSDGTGAELLTGTLSPSEPLVTFAPIAAAPTGDRGPMDSFTLTVIDQDHFTWVPLDRGWRAVFTRER
ncbi:MAG: hypothetical protein AUI08_00525 [Gemmatimonadetes bacterium 13_2_20CM_2_65_7]|nr:MAG: hypothetical protein AUI08_00525 [Gemmatimonadetes bacterium 13_2_20CM_2_65_7]OLD00820.1 MAG: hypothetical protein AUI89_05390 [Gemmatimonadetes bacterium 13_1_40CM_3_65_8]